MGGTANFCVVYPDGTRESALAYNHAMVAPCLNFEIRNATPARATVLMRDHMDHLRKEMDEDEAECSYGLAPDGYGLVMMDLGRRAIYEYQDYAPVNYFYQALLSSKYWPETFANAKAFAEAGQILIAEGLIRDPYPLVLGVEPFEAYLKKEHARAEALGRRLVIYDAWAVHEYRDDEGHDLFDQIQKDYVLTPREKEQWSRFLAGDC